jgi:DNA gyrase subunit A
MAEIGELIAARKLPQLEGVNDETNEENGLRIAIDLKSGADSAAVMAYLFKHTSLEQNFGYNATCLVPADRGLTVPASAGSEATAAALSGLPLRNRPTSA